MSLVAPWPEGPERIHVPVAVGISLARSLSRAFGVELRLKWPNDLLAGRQEDRRHPRRRSNPAGRGRIRRRRPRPERRGHAVRPRRPGPSLRDLTRSRRGRPGGTRRGRAARRRSLRPRCFPRRGALRPSGVLRRGDGPPAGRPPRGAGRGEDRPWPVLGALEGRPPEARDRNGRHRADLRRRDVVLRR